MVSPGFEQGQLKGLARLEAHVRNLDPATPTARERLDLVLGPELAHKLVFALCTGTRISRVRCAA